MSEKISKYISYRNIFYLHPPKTFTIYKTTISNNWLTVDTKFNNMTNYKFFNYTKQFNKYNNM